MPQPLPNPRLNNKVRLPQGLNTGATVDLGEAIAQNRQIPPTSNIAASQSVKGAVNQAATENWGRQQTQKKLGELVTYNISDIPPGDDTFVDLTGWQPNTKLSFSEKLKQFPLANPARYEDGVTDVRDYNGQNVVSYRDYMNVVQNAPTIDNQVVDKLPFRDTAVGKVAFKTHWDTIARRTAPYTKAIIKNPNYSNAVSVWAEHTNPSFDLFPAYTLGRSKFISSVVRSHHKAPRELQNLVIREHELPLTSEMLNERQVINDIDSTQKWGMNNSGDSLIDLNLGSKRFYELNPTGQYVPALGKYIGRESTSYELNDINRGVKGESDFRKIFDNTPVSDYYSTTPQWASNPELHRRNLVRIATNPEVYPSVPIELLKEHQNSLQQFVGDWYNAKRGSTKGRLILPLSDSRVKAARLQHYGALQNIKADEQNLLNAHSGSFNMVVDPDNHRDRVVASGLLPDVPIHPLEGLYRSGKPWMPSKNKEGQISSIELPKNLALEVPGMGRFPIAGGVSTDISFGNKEPVSLVDGVVQMKEGKELALKNVVRDRSSTWGMDAQDALGAKRVIANNAKAKFEAIRNSSSATDEEKYAAWSAAHKHEAEYQQGLQNLQRAYTYEPQPNVQPVSVTLTVPHDDSSSIELLRSHGMEIASSDLTPQGMVVKASGNLPLDVQMKLNAQLASRFNREELVLPHNVSIANTASAFENAGISPNSLVQGVQWGKNNHYEDVIVNPGKVIGYWKGQRVTRGNVEQPTVRQIATAGATVIESDPELQQLIAARDKQKLIQRDRLIETVNLKRAERGEPLLGVGSNGQLFHLPNDSISSLNGEDIDRTVSNAAVQKRQAFNDEANTVLNQALHNAAVRQSAINKQLALGIENNTMPKPSLPSSKQPRNLNSYSDDWEIAQSDVHPMDRIAAENIQQPVVIPSTVDLNSTPLPNIFRTNIPIEGSDTPWVYNRPSRPAPEVSLEYGAKNYGQPLNPADNSLSITNHSKRVDHNFPASPPTVIHDDLWHEYKHSAQPSTPQPAPVIVQDPANTWNRYIPAATAIAGLGIGGGAVYAMSDRDNSEEEQLRQQLMQQQLMLQQVRGIRR